MDVMISLQTLDCYKCGTAFAIQYGIYEACRNNSSKEFFCPNGHGQVFKVSVAEKLRGKLKASEDRLAREVTRHDQTRADRDAVQRSLSATKGVVTRIRNRVGNGVCPCCNRTFQDLQRHMQSKHPEFAQDG